MAEKKKRTKTTKDTPSSRVTYGVNPKTGERILIKQSAHKPSNTNTKNTIKVKLTEDTKTAPSQKLYIASTGYQHKTKEELIEALNDLHLKHADLLNKNVHLEIENEKLSKEITRLQNKIEQLLYYRPQLYFHDIYKNPIDPTNLPKPPEPITQEERDSGTRPYKGKNDQRDPIEYLKKYYSKYLPTLNPELKILPARFWPLAQNTLFKMEPNLKSALQNKDCNSIIQSSKSNQNNEAAVQKIDCLTIIPSSKTINKDKQGIVIKLLNISTKPCNYEDVEFYMSILKNIKDGIYIECKKSKE